MAGLRQAKLVSVLGRPITVALNDATFRLVFDFDFEQRAGTGRLLQLHFRRRLNFVDDHGIRSQHIGWR